VAHSCSILGCLDVAGRLERELAAVTAYVDDFAASAGRDVRVTFLQRSLVLVTVTARVLRQLALDAATTTSNVQLSVEAHEHALRVRLNVLMRATYTLRRREPEIPTTAFTARFRDVHSVCIHLNDQAVQIHSRWQEQRGSNPPRDAATRQALAYQALDDAEIAFERLGRESDLEHFLRVGAATTCEPVSLACRELAATVGLALASANNDADSTQPAACSVDRTAS